jgi:hypothetical protein
MSDYAVPQGLPELRWGRHISPEQGACLMEYVSVLAGERFSDRPACVDPLLVQLAWAVNDTTNSKLRARLPDLAPRFIGTAQGGPQAAPAIVIACCRFAQPYLSPSSRSSLARGQRRAEARLQRVNGWIAAGRAVRGVRRYRLLHAEPALQTAVSAVAAADLAALPRLLLEAITAVEMLQPADTTPATAPSRVAERP